MGRFNFGKNWLEFSKYVLDEDKLLAAQESLSELIGQDNIEGSSFLDIGCGSGIFSIAAKRLGAKEVIGFDVSRESVQSAELNKKKFSNTPEIKFHVQSILEDGYKQFGKFDIVYSWGALHHTQDMWQAIRNSAELVNPGGLFTIAIYNKHWSSPFWKLVKRTYNFSPKLIQRLLVWFFYAIILCTKFLVTFKNPYQKKRGMNFYHDIVDWVGGYPYEYAKVEEIVTFVPALGFKLRKVVRAGLPTGNNEFVFEKK